MFIRVVNIKFSSKIEADAMNALAKHELIDVLPGILSIEVVRITDLHSIVINKFDSKESAEKCGKNVFDCVYAIQNNQHERKLKNYHVDWDTVKIFYAKNIQINIQ